MATSYNTVTVTTSATLIKAANNARKGILIMNNSSATIYIGPDSSITTSNAVPLLAQATLVNSGYDDDWKGAIYGIVAADTANVRYWEWES